MPRSIGSISGQIALSVYRKALLVEVVVAGTPYRLTDFYTTVTQTIDSVSRTFDPAGVVVTGIGEDMDTGIDDVTLTIWNVDLVFSTIAFTGDGLRNAAISVWEGWFDPTTGAWVDYVELFLGRASETNFNEDAVTLKVVPHNVPWVIKVPGDTFTTTCGLRFKGPQCQYAVMAAPTGLAVTAPSGAGLAPGTYYYQVSAIGFGGETLACTEVSSTSALNRDRHIAWSAVPFARSYSVYGRVTGGSKLKIGNTTGLFFDDNGTVTPAGALPSTNTTGAATSCLRTYVDCTAKQNVLHFRGFRYLPDPTKTISWNGASTDLTTRGG